MKTWMVRAGRGGKFFERFQQTGVVAIGWEGTGDLSEANTRERMVDLVREAYPNYPNQKVLITAGQLYRFAHDFEVGDQVITYDSGARVYLCGKIDGEYVFNKSADDEVFLNTRKLKWSHEKPRDELTSFAQNSLGAISTIFLVPEEFSRELWSEKAVISEAPQVELDDVSAYEFGALDAEAAEAKSTEQIKDYVSRLDWEQMQELVAALLRAMGYRTKISPKGSDRGRDIVASPDGFGFQDPRIVVEVKHRPKLRMGAPEIRSFLGGRHPSDKGLYVSTGGFTSEARYEADRANIPLTLMDFDELVEAIVDHYSDFDDAARQLLPLKPVYWLVSS